MTRRPFSIVDVFAEHKYAGNQLAVIRAAGDLSDDEMLKLTREMNYAETTFVLSDEPRDGGYDVRIWTPGGEVPFAGHPTLGTAFVIARDIIGEPVAQVTLNLKVGPIPVRFPAEGSDGVLWMRQIPPSFGGTLDRAEVAATLGLTPDQIDDRYPIQAVSTGLPFFIVPLRSLQAVQAARVNGDRLTRLVRDQDADAIMVFTPHACHADNDIHARVFIDLKGIPEDPATGSANGCLAAYLSRYSVLGAAHVAARVEQGYEIHRPSLLHIKAWPEDERLAIEVGGRVIATACGELV